MPKLPITLDYGYLAPDVNVDQVVAWQDQVDLAAEKVSSGGGLGEDFLGWVDPGKIVSDDEVKQIKDLAKGIRDNSDALISIGIGGSYLGARAVIEALGTDDGPEILYAGNSISAHEHSRVLKKLEGKRFSINAISKSGTKETLVSKDQSNWSQGSRKHPCASKRRSKSGSQSLHVRSRPSSASRPSGEPWTVSTRKSFQAGR